jgi:hypothetical protein
MRRFLVVLAVVTLAGSCAWPWDSTITGPAQDVNVNVQIGQQPSPAPSASPAAGTLTPPAYVKVVAFGCQCPNANQTCTGPELQTGCVADITCTPKRADGTDQTEAEHGPIATWVLEQGTGIVDVSPAPNPFNREVRGLALGSWTLSCTVQGIKGAMTGVVK